MSIRDLRKEYRKGTLNPEDLGPDPILAFSKWFAEANEQDDIPEPNAMTLASVDSDGNPSARIVLLKEIRENGFVFYTNYRSRKGEELLSTKKSALVFWWEPLARQIRIEGTTEKIPESESENYFSSRPRGSQIGAWVSDQSEIINSRSELEEKLSTYNTQFGDDLVPKPDHWGGFIVKPFMIEFWQGGLQRLHDRVRFQRQEDTWHIDRLSP